MAHQPERGRSVTALKWALPLLPALLVLAGCFLLPMLELGRMSFLEYNRATVYTSKVTLGNYAKFFSDRFYFTMVASSLKVGLWTTCVTLVVAYPVAYYLTTIAGWERTLLSGICLLPVFVTVLVGTLGWYLLLLPFGVTQKAMTVLGFVRGPLGWLNTFAALIAVMVYLYAPYAILILASGLQNVDRQKINAARILGASTWQVFWRVIIPLTMPAIVSSAILVFSLSISSYLVPVLVTGQRLRLLPMAIFSYTTDLLNWPFASVLALVLLVIVAAATYVFTAVTNRVTARGKWGMV